MCLDNIFLPYGPTQNKADTHSSIETTFNTKHGYNCDDKKKKTF